VGGGDEPGTFIQAFPKNCIIGVEGWQLSKECNDVLGLQYVPGEEYKLMPLLNGIDSAVCKHLKCTNAFGNNHAQFFSKIDIHVYEGKYHLLEHLHSSGHIV
jgi:hypothetical protein